MELKYFVFMGIVGLAAGFTIPTQESNPHGEANSDLESSFSASPSSDASGGSRDKRHLFKKLKKHQDTVYVNRRYDTGVEYRPNREVHHHHHYSYPAPPQNYQTYQPTPNEYHHYHGAASGYQQGYASQGSSTYYSGGYSTGGNYYSRPNYGDGGYAHYGGVGGYSGPPPPPPPQQQPPVGPVSAVPLATAHNAVDRGQGAAAVNNIAIIHARAGSSNNLVESESKILPKPLPVDIEDVLNRMAEE